jgi:hypothetical protein
MQISRIRLSDKTSRALLRATPSAAIEHSSELIGCPISMFLTTSCVCLELRSFPSTGVTRLQRYYEPLRHPKAPGLSLAGVRLVIPAPRLGASRVACAFLVCMLSLLPRRSDWECSLLGSPAVSVFPERVIGSTCATTFSRIAQRSHYITACTLAESPYVTRYTRGFSHFVTSMTAPVTSGWSGCRAGFAPAGKAPPFHGAHPLRPFTLRGTHDSRNASISRK